MNIAKIMEKIQIHYKCRNSIYPGSNHQRFTVPDDKVFWDISWPEYNPVNFTSKAAENKPWADPPINDSSFQPVWNSLDGAVNRKSHVKPYKILGKLPLNPIGRTGISGRGLLGRWGPNHAADPIITRWKRNSNKAVEYDHSTQKPILQFVGIMRRDCKQWAIPGGMVDPNEVVTATLKREFLEEAMNILATSDKDKKNKEALVEEFFAKGVEVYKGYVDDPRNTDNSWMETVATNFHDETGSYTDQMELTAGDDATNVRWIDIHSGLELYASHCDFIARVAQIRCSHW